MKSLGLRLVAILIAAIFALSACVGTTSIIGSWGDERSIHLRLFNDGNGIWLDGTTITWSEEGNILTITHQDGTEEQFRFHVTGGRLQLYFLNGVRFESFVRLWG